MEDVEPPHSAPHVVDVPSQAKRAHMTFPQRYTHQVLALLIKSCLVSVRRTVSLVLHLLFGPLMILALWGLERAWIDAENTRRRDEPGPAPTRCTLSRAAVGILNLIGAGSADQEILAVPINGGVFLLIIMTASAVFHMQTLLDEKRCDHRPS